jgi:predicted MFS family arabinose efflux permease
MQALPRPVAGPLVLAVGFATLIVIGTDFFVVSPLLTPISQQYRASPGTAGIMVTAFSAAYVVAAPWLGAQADRFGRRRVLVAGLVGFSLANLLTGLAPTFPLLVATRVAAGLAAAAVTPSVYALVAQIAPVERRAAWLSVVLSGLLISLSTGAPSGTIAAAVLGWRWAFFALAALGALLAPINHRVWPGVRPPARSEQKRVDLATKIRAVSVTALWAFAVYMLYTFLGSGLGTVAGLSTGVVAAALVVYGSGAVLGSLGGGRLADRGGPARVATLSLLALAVVQLLVDLALRAPTGVLLALLGVFALVAYPYVPSYQARLVHAFPRQSGSLLAWNNSALYVGTAVGSAIGGLLFSTVGFRVIPVVGAIAAIAGALVCNRWAARTADSVEPVATQQRA